MVQRMGFASGSVSFKRFAVLGDAPASVDQNMLDALSANALRPSEVGVPEEAEYGWSGGRHILDANFSFDNNVYADALLLGLRVDSNKVPGDLKKAYQLMEEEAAASTNPSGFISKNQKKDVKDIVRRRVDDELRDGRHRRSKLVPILWDLPSQTLYTPAAGKNQELLLEIFERTFGLSLLPLSAGSIAMRQLEPRGKRRDYEDLRPTRFVPGPEGDGQFPEYPWVAKGPEPKDFLGNEFLLWLWNEADHKGGVVALEGGGDASVLIDRSLDLDCAYGISGRDSLRAEGPTRMPEARDALRSGKLPRKAGFVYESAGLQFSFTLNAETFAFGTVKLPEVEDAENPRVVFEERIGMLRDLCRSFDALFGTFLKRRASSTWDTETTNLRRWIQQPQKASAAA